MLSIELSNNIMKLDKQIKALEWQIKQDANDKDRTIHQEALKALKERKEQLEVGD